MFVSSYSTYIDTTTSKRDKIAREESSQKKVTSFSNALSKTVSKNPTFIKEIPLNYISNYKALNNRQRIQERLQEKTTFSKPSAMLFSKLAAQSRAQVSYVSNSNMFSLIQKPKPIINQTPKLDANLPKSVQELQAGFKREQMIQAYAANESYYSITAA